MLLAITGYAHRVKQLQARIAETEALTCKIDDILYSLDELNRYAEYNSLEHAYDLLIDEQDKLIKEIEILETLKLNAEITQIIYDIDNMLETETSNNLALARTYAIDAVSSLNSKINK